MILLIFQAYPPLFKDQDLQILCDSLGAKIDAVTSGNDCKISGTTEGHAMRPRIYDYAANQTRSRTLLSQDSAFQIANRNEQFNDGAFGSSYRTYNVDDSVVNRSRYGISIGNNNSIIVTNGGSAHLDLAVDFLFKYGFKFNIGNMLDGNPFTYWACQNTTAPVRFCIDSTELKTPLESLALDSIWLLNCNIINLRLKGNTVPAAWGAPPFDQYISFIIDSGIVTNSYGIAGTDVILTITDSTKNWIPNQFKNVDSPYYIIRGDSAFTWFGGKIISNTKNSINYKLSTNLDGSDFVELLIAYPYAIVTSHMFKKFSTVSSYRYWAIEIMPNQAGDYQCYCDGVAKISELGLGVSIPLTEYGDVGLSMINKNIVDTAVQNDGFSSIIITPTRSLGEIKLMFNNVTRTIKDRIVDIFYDHVTNNKSFWFLWNEYYDVDPILCVFIDRSLAITETFVDYETLNNQTEYEEMIPIYNVSMNVRQRT